jgi:pimeloyl-ACP methyl ester carboxylesterase
MNKDTYNRQYTELSNGCKLSYIDEGAGAQTIIFIHGLSNYSLGWQKNIDGLKQHYRCIAIDLPGNGYSSRGAFEYSMAFFADCIHGLIVNLGLENVCLCGHSMGGQIAITTVLKYPDAIDKLVLCAPAGFEEFTATERMMYMASIQIFDVFSSEENSLRKTMQSSFYMFPEEAKGMVDELAKLMKEHDIKDYRAMVEACIYAMLHEPVFDKLIFITKPTLVLFGEKDTLIPNKILHPVSTKNIAEKGMAHLNNATLEMIPQCGHFLQWEQSGEVNHYMHSFLKRV